MRCCAICVVKDAEDRIGEWIAYHLVLGFDAIFLIDNGSTDRTKEVIDAFHAYPVKRWDWPMTGPFWQLRAYEHALWKIRRSFDWALCIDDDEFLILPSKPLHKFLSKTPRRVSSIAFPWAIYGSSGHLQHPDDQLVIEAYQHRSAENFGPNRHIKSFVRPDKVLECLSPHFFHVEGLHIEPSGAKINLDSLMDRNPDFSFGRINHYFVRSRMCWSKKISRGYRDIVRSDEDFYAYDQNEVFDNMAALKSGDVRALLQSAGLPFVS